MLQPWFRSQLIERVKVKLEYMVHEQAWLINEQVKSQLTGLFESALDEMTSSSSKVQCAEQPGMPWVTRNVSTPQRTSESSNGRLSSSHGVESSHSNYLRSTNGDFTIREESYVNLDELIGTYEDACYQLHTEFEMFDEESTKNPIPSREGLDSKEVRIDKGKSRQLSGNEPSSPYITRPNTNSPTYAGVYHADFPSDRHMRVPPNQALTRQPHSSSTDLTCQRSVERPGTMNTNDSNLEHNPVCSPDVEFSEIDSARSLFWEPLSKLEMELHDMQDWWDEN
jgi:hypothetical protein